MSCWGNFMKVKTDAHLFTKFYKVHCTRAFNLLGGVNQGSGLLLARGLEKGQPLPLVNTLEKIECSLTESNNWWSGWYPWRPSGLPCPPGCIWAGGAEVAWIPPTHTVGGCYRATGLQGYRSSKRASKSCFIGEKIISIRHFGFHKSIDCLEMTFKAHQGHLSHGVAELLL